MKPIIGITTYGADENKITADYYKRYVALPELYIDAVRRAGGIPVLLPPEEAEIDDLILAIDGFIIAGGADIHPERYDGNMSHPNLTKHDTGRDEFEIKLVQALTQQASKPVLCICRGMQVLNVALGGTMTEHIPDIRDVDTHRNHDGMWITHDVQIRDDSKLAFASGVTTVHTYSGHHQAVKQVANQLAVVATAPDGIIEGLEHKTHPWMIGVQWHPEKSANEDTTQQALFDQLVVQVREQTSHIKRVP